MKARTQVAPRTAKNIPTFLAQEPRDSRCPRRPTERRAHRRQNRVHHNGEFVNDVRVSPIDEVVVEEDELSRAARRPRTGASGSPPRSRRTTRSRRRDSQNCGHRVPRGWVDLLLGAPWVGFVEEEVYQEASPRELGENDSARVPKFQVPGDNDLQKNPSSQNCSSKSGACVDL